MKKAPTFLAGMLTTLLIGSLSVGALAATGAFTITVEPVNIQVNGATFAPVDANGDPVPVFSYNGTTYAPLRALAEAYGLEVGWDQGAKMATVGEVAGPDAAVADSVGSDTANILGTTEDAEYEAFKGMWTYTVDKSSALICAIDIPAVSSWWDSAPLETKSDYATRMAVELHSLCQKSDPLTPPGYLFRCEENLVSVIVGTQTNIVHFFND